MQRGEPAKALEVLTHGLTLDVDRPPFLVKLGEAHLELKQYDEAEKVLKEAVALRADVPARPVQPGAASTSSAATPARRARAYEAEAATNPENYGAQFNLGKLLLKEGRLAEATTRFRAAVDARPEFAEGYLYLAKALLDGGDLPGRGAGRDRGAVRNPPTARSRRSATTCSPTSTAAWAARTRRRARSRGRGRWSAGDERSA